MNRVQKLKASYVATLLIVFAAACANQSNSSMGGNLTPSSTTGGTYTPPTYSGGATVALSNVNNLILSQYVGYPVTAATTIYLNLNVISMSGVYLGEANISFKDTNGIAHNGNFKSGLDSSHGNNQNILTTNTNTGASTYRFFFEDPLGAIIVTIQNTNLGNDNLAPSYNGQVYFRNFNSSAPNPLYQAYTDSIGNYWPPNPYAFCWTGQITTGPYDCRNMSVPPSTSGSKAFIQLGDFYGIDKSALGL